MRRPFPGRGASRTWRAAAIAAALVFLGAAGACGGGGGGAGPDVDARDSAGVRIVEVARLPTGELPWRMGAEPRVRIGGGTADERAQLYRVAGAALRSDGRIVVGNSGSAEVRLFEADGTPAGAVGRPGGGPGEFGSLTLVGLLPGDSALVHDGRHGRLTVITPEMALGRTTPITVGGQPVRTFAAGLLRGGPLVATGSARLGDTPRTGLMDPVAPVYLVGVDGAVVDSAGPFPGRPLYLELGDAGMRLTRIPFGTETEVTAGPDRFHVGTADAYEIRTFARDGRLVRVLRVAEARRPVTAEDLAAHVERALENAAEGSRPALRRSYEAMPVPDRMPAHGRLVADGLGHLWVERYRGPEGGPPTWTVFDPEGRPLGTVTTPEGLYILEIGADYILGTGSDELDRPWVGVWTLERGGDSARP